MSHIPNQLCIHGLISEMRMHTAMKKQTPLKRIYDHFYFKLVSEVSEDITALNSINCMTTEPQQYHKIQVIQKEVYIFKNLFYKYY
jgi:hypothetical protein